MPKNNLKPKNLSKKPFQKKKVSFGILSVEKNTKSETLVIAKEQSDRSNLTPWRHPEQSEGSLYRSPRFARNHKGRFAFLQNMSGCGSRLWIINPKLQIKDLIG